MARASSHRIHITFSCVSLILLFYGVKQSYPILVDREAAFGLAAYLPLSYWAGLALITIVSAAVFLKAHTKQDASNILVLLIVSLFLFGVTVLFEENPTQPETLYPFSEVRLLLESGHIDIANPPAGQTVSYHSWPAFHFLNAAIFELTGMDPVSSLGFLKYMLLYFLLSFVVVTYATGKRLGLEPNWCFLISFLAVASWFPGYAGLYYPRAIAMLLYLSIFMLLVTGRRTGASTVVIVLLFVAALLTHGMVVLLLIPAATSLALYRKDIGLVVLFVAAVSAWYMYEAVIPLQIGIGQLRNPFWEILQLARIERYREPILAIAPVIRISRLIYLASYVFLMLLCVILNMFLEMAPGRREQILALFAFAIGGALTLGLGFGEQTYRTYLYLVLPALCVVGLSLPRRKIFRGLMIALMFVFVGAHIPANYSIEGVYGQVPTMEVRGAEFVATKVNLANLSVFYGYGPQIILYYNPALLGRVSFTNADVLYEEFRFMTEEKNHYLPSPIARLDDVSYVITSMQTARVPRFNWETWPSTEAGLKSNVVYANGSFQVYDNHTRTGR